LLECRQEPQLLQFCSNTQDEVGPVDLVMDLPSEDTAATLMAKLEPATSASESQLSDIGSTTKLDVHGPERPPGTGICRKSCSFDCYCSCHSEDERTPHLSLKRRMTVLSVVIRPRRKCSAPNCQRTAPPRSKKVVLPSANFSQALATLVSSRGWTVKHHLNTYRSVPETSNSMRYAKHGDLNNLKACIESGEATPFDTGPDGWSLLHVG
jgi:hypothetical protein